MIEVKEAYLTPNQYSRPQIKLRAVQGIVMHYVQNPGTSAMFNRNWFERRRYGKTGFGSAHFIVDLTGDILVCVPPNEIAYHCGEDRKAGFYYTDLARDRFGTWPNAVTLGIELCHLDVNGRFTDETKGAAAHLCACLCEQYNLDPYYDIVRHFDITTKLCPKFFVDYPTAFLRFKEEAKRRMLNRECATGGNS